MPAHSFNYPQEINDEDKKIFKEKTLRRNPDILYFDTKKNNSRCNLIFFTNFLHHWKAAIINQYPGTIEVPLPDKVDLKLSGANKGNVNIYPNGKFVIQGTESNFVEFENRFDTLRLIAETNRTN